MRATGIVRTTDDLGRLVIPKEIRRATGAGDNQPYEFFVDSNGDIILHRYECECEDTMRVVLYATVKEGEVLGDQSLPQVYKRLVGGEIVTVIGHDMVPLLITYANAQGRGVGFRYMGSRCELLIDSLEEYEEE